MRLLQIDNETGDEFSLVEFIGDTPRYAILSHTWGPNGTEVTYRDLVEGTGKDKAGYKKIRACGRQSAKAKYKYFWVDTCCIDKTSSAELSEAINSMYRWYEEAGVCFAYIEDALPSLPMSEWTISNIRWFTRGWTLQELLAPKEVEFFDTDWSALGTRTEHAPLLSVITKIDSIALGGHFPSENLLGYNKNGRMDLRTFSIASKMSWAAERTTTRSEDVAYCLLGIFDVNMPLLYGEGSTKAFVRLQEEIMKGSNDINLRLVPTNRILRTLIWTSRALGRVSIGFYQFWLRQPSLYFICQRFFCDDEQRLAHHFTHGATRGALPRRSTTLHDL